MRALVLFILGLCWQTAAGVTIPAVAYHDIVLARNGDPYAITVAQFDEQLAYLKRKGYQPIGLRDLDAARRGIRPLPTRPVLLTFDDALRSFHVHAWPRLQRYGYPAVVSVVTSWVDGRRRPDWDAAIMTWDELRALAETPGIDLISHSDDLHHGIKADAYGTSVPVATARGYDAKTRTFEDERHRQTRVAADLARSVARMRAELNQSPRAVAWPYGEYDQAMATQAAALGMEYHLTLSDAPTTLADLPRINRFTLRGYQGLADFAAALAFWAHARRDRRFVQFDFSAFQGLPDAAVESVLARKLERLQLLRVNAVVLAPFTDDGAQAFFHTTSLSREHDLALRVTMAILRRTAVERIYVRLPQQLDGDRAVRLVADYLRRHPLHGLLVSGNVDSADVDRMRSLVSQYRPGTRLFVGDCGRGATDDGCWQEVDVTAVAARSTALGALDGDSTLVVIRRGGASDAELADTLRAVRAAGVRHYGYAPDDADHNRPDARFVVGPLHAHTIRTRAP